MIGDSTYDVRAGKAASLPVVTCPGDTFPSRVAASLLRAVGLPELIAPTLADYEGLAVKLGRQPDAVAALKARLAANLPTAPLFDTARLTRHIEAAYTTMVERQRSGIPAPGMRPRSCRPRQLT